MRSEKATHEWEGAGLCAEDVACLAVTVRVKRGVVERRTDGNEEGKSPAWTLSRTRKEEGEWEWRQRRAMARGGRSVAEIQTKEIEIALSPQFCRSSAFGC